MNKNFKLLLLAGCLFMASCGSSDNSFFNPKNEQAAENFKHYQPKAETQKKIDKLLSVMSVEEKAIQLASKYPNKNDRLGIPHIQACEALHGLMSNQATSFPQSIALGATWDPDLVQRAGAVVGREARVSGSQYCYSPNLGLAREARWGRFEECYGEDPVLVGKIGTAYIKGLQGVGDEYLDQNHVLAAAKHFVADGRPRAGHNGASEEMSKRILHELYLKPYRMAIQEAQLGGIMPAHHSLNGQPCHSNEWLLVDVLRNEYGFDGIIVCDNGDIRCIKDNFRIYETYEEVAKAAIEAGVNSELSWQTPWDGKRMFGNTLVKAVENGMVSMEVLDRAVSKILQYKIEMQLFGTDNFDEKGYNDLAKQKEIKAYADTKTTHSVAKRQEGWEKVFFDKKSDDVALEAARKAITLLKNQGELLPLDVNRLNTIAVIGPNANDKKLLGTYSTAQPRHFTTVKQGIENVVKDRAQVLYEQGVDISDDTDRSGIVKAVNIAKRSDVAIIVLGDNEYTIKENQDRDNIKLAGLQNELLEAVVNAGKPVVLMLIHGRTPDLEYAAANVNAILSGWFLGQDTGRAVAETIFGLNNPGGKTPVTFPRNTGMLPQCYNDLPAGRKHSVYKGNATPLYPFGYGLSYTKFKYGDVTLSATEMRSADDIIYAEVMVKNVGKRDGDEVVQMYIRDEVATLLRPEIELKNFERIHLKAGEERMVKFPISRAELEFRKDDQWIVEPGAFRVLIGTSSAKTTSAKFKLI